MRPSLGTLDGIVQNIIKAMRIREKRKAIGSGRISKACKARPPGGDASFEVKTNGRVCHIYHRFSTNLDENIVFITNEDLLSV